MIALKQEYAKQIKDIAEKLDMSFEDVMTLSFFGGSPERNKKIKERLVNRMYIVTCGMYEDKHNEFVTNNVDDAVEFALLKHDCLANHESFNTLEVWEDGVLICEYGAYAYHKVSKTNNLSCSEFKEDLKKYA